MDGQLQKISFDSYSTIWTPRLYIKYPHNDGITSNEETLRHSSFHQVSIGSPSQTIYSRSTQPHNANTGGNLCHIPNPSVYTTPSILQESNCQIGQRLGPSLTSGSSQHTRTELVSSLQYNDPGSAYQWNLQHNSRHGVSSNLLQEPMADQIFCIRGAQ